MGACGVPEVPGGGVAPNWPPSKEVLPLLVPPRPLVGLSVALTPNELAPSKPPREGVDQAAVEALSEMVRRPDGVEEPIPGRIGTVACVGRFAFLTGLYVGPSAAAGDDVSALAWPATPPRDGVRIV